MKRFLDETAAAAMPSAQRKACRALRKACRPLRNRVVVVAVLAGFMAGCSTTLEQSEGVVAARDHLGTLAPGSWEAAAVAGPVDPVASVAFGDPALERMVADVLAANPDLAAAASRVAVAEADAKIAGADLFPSLGLGGGGGRERQVFVGFPVDDPSLPDPLSVTYTRLGVSLDLSWEIDVWGRLRANRQAAGADADAARAALEGARLSLAGQAAKSWFALIEAREQMALAERTLASWAASAGHVEERYESGVRSPLDVRLSRTQVAGAEARRAQRRSALGHVARQFEVLLGRYPSAAAAEATVAAARPLAEWRDLPPLPAGVPIQVLERRPDLREAAQRVFAADRRVAVAKRSLLPRIALTGSAGTVSDDFAHLLDGDFGLWSWAANFMQPIFEGGRLRGAVLKAEAAANAAAATYVSTALVAFAEVENALADEASLAEFEDALERAAVEADAAERLAEERYRSGLEAYVTLLEARRASLEADSALIDARRRRLENRIDLVLALGGGIGSSEAVAPGSANPRDGFAAGTDDSLAGAPGEAAPGGPAAHSVEGTAGNDATDGNQGAATPGNHATDGNQGAATPGNDAAAVGGEGGHAAKGNS